MLRFRRAPEVTMPTNTIPPGFMDVVQVMG
jgi:hypothetical protein